MSGERASVGRAAEVPGAAGPSAAGAHFTLPATPGRLRAAFATGGLRRRVRRGRGRAYR